MYIYNYVYNPWNNLSTNDEVKTKVRLRTERRAANWHGEKAK